MADEERIVEHRSRLERALEWLTNGWGRWAVLGFAVILTLLVAWIAARADTEPLTRGEGSAFASAVDALRAVLAVGFITGIASMAVVQTLKNLSSVRGAFHKVEIRNYLGDRGYASLRLALGHDAFGKQWARSDNGRWLEPRKRRHDRYIFDLPLEQLIGQIGSAADLAMDQPEQYRDLILGLAPETEESAISNLERGLDNDTRSNDTRSQARAVVGPRLQRGLDVMQIVIGHRWRWFVRSAALALCAPIAIAVVELSGTVGVAKWTTTTAAVVLGGFFAWLGRDVVAVVERWRR